MDTILIVEDNQQDSELLKEILLSSGAEYDIESADSEQGAIKALENGRSPDCILLNLRLKDADGFETLGRIREKVEDFIPILIVSSFTGEDDRTKCLDLGATDFINKPFISEEIKARVVAQIKFKKKFDETIWVEQKTNEGIKTLYRELEKRNEELKKLDKLKSDFVSTVSHELRTPLAITTEGLNLVIDGITGEINEKQENILVTSRDNLGRLNTIINNLLDISKIEAGKVEIKRGFVDLNQILKDLVDSYQTVVKNKKIVLTYQSSQENVFMLIDGDKIIQVMNNLLNNATKFTPEGGSIEVGMNATSNEVKVSVKDSGIGISEEDFPKLFGKFQQFSRSEGPGAKGTGLGLSITKSLIELHGGKIWAESKVDQGTTFLFTLPSLTTIAEEFNKDFDEMIKDAASAPYRLMFIIVQLQNIDALLQKWGKEDVLRMINTLYSSLNQVVSYSKDRVYLYDSHNIYFILPDTNKTGGALVEKRIKEAIHDLYFMKEREGVIPDFKIGMSEYPDDAKDRVGLIKLARRDVVKPKSVLIVDDHQQVVRLLGMRLESCGYQVFSAYDGEEALAVIEKTVPDLIVLDIAMPKMSGYELYGRLKERKETSHVPVVMLSAQDVDAGKHNSVTPGNVPVVQKTGGFQKVVGVVNDLL